VDDDLTLQVKAHDQRTYKDGDNRSLCTRAVIYLLEGVALAGIIGGSSEPARRPSARHMRAACEPVTARSTPHASCWKSIEAIEETPSTKSRASARWRWRISSRGGKLDASELGTRLAEAFPMSHSGNSPKVNLARYADDFIITGASKELLENEVKPVVEHFLGERGLELSKEKTIVTHVKDGFDFLGQHVRQYKSGVILTTPSKKNVHAFLEKVRGSLKANKDTSAGRLIVLLNPIIRGWANYHRFGASSRVFNTVDSAIFKAVWQWARRRHPTKSATWVRKKYFTTQGTMNWVFTGTMTEKDGTVYPVHLRRASDIPIQRHTLIQGKANPFDPKWETYFEKRLDVKMVHNLTGKRKLLYLWKEQKGLCPLCNQKITKITGWHSHHRLWRSKGGSDGTENRVLLHPNCHQQVHSQSLHVEKPRPVKRAE